MLSGIHKKYGMFIGNNMNKLIVRDADGYSGMCFGARNAEGERNLVMQWACCVQHILLEGRI